MASPEPMKTKTPLANPAPLGLMGFGVTTILLNLVNAGYIPLDSTILSMGMFFGGGAQLFAGAMEYKNGNTFGTTAFFSYGFFWESFVFLVMLPKLGLSTFAPTAASMQAYLVMWGVFTLLMFIATLRLNGALMVVFGTLFILFFLLAAGETNSSIHTIAGYEGVLCGLAAMYASIAQILNEVYGRTLLPIFPRNAR